MVENAEADDQKALKEEAVRLIYEVNNAGRMQNVFDLRDLLPHEAADKTVQAIQLARENQWSAFLLLLGLPDDREFDSDGIGEYYIKQIRTAVINQIIDENIRYAEQPGAVVCGFPPFAGKWQKPKTPGVVEFTDAVVESLLRKCGLPVDVFECEIATLHLSPEQIRQQKLKRAEEYEIKKPDVSGASGGGVRARMRRHLEAVGLARPSEKPMLTTKAKKNLETTKKETRIVNPEDAPASWYFKLIVLAFIVAIFGLWAYRVTQILSV